MLSCLLVCVSVAFGSAGAQRTAQPGAIVKNPGDVPAGGTFTARPGETVIVYGAANRRCSVPNFEDVLSSGVSPKYGTLSDAGVGVRYSRRCGPRTRVRAVAYTAGQEGAGQVDRFDIFGDRVTVTIAR